MTVLDTVVQSLTRAADHNRNDVVGPRVILWTDGDRLWEPVTDLLRAAMPRLFVLGEFDSGKRSGPAAYLRFQLPAAPGVAGEVPVLYLPGVSRAAFRSAGDCPEEARHLFALQFEGQFWIQRNGKDWTPSAFLASAEGGLGLDLARDAETASALRECLGKVLEAEVPSLSGRRLEAPDFRGLVADDPVRMLLRWIGQPRVWQERWKGPEWTSFRAICRKDFGFDPEKDGELAAAELLAARSSDWQPVWQRFADAPRNFPGVEDLLRRLSPPDLFACQESFPTVNQQREDELRASLLSLAQLDGTAAQDRVLDLAKREGPRVNWVWARLDKAPLASAISALARLVTAGRAFGGGKDWSSLHVNYTEHGWQVDAAALDALACVRSPADLAAVESALKGVYQPWLDQLAQVTQGLAATYPNPNSTTARPLPVAKGSIILFVDGLRFDLGRRLAAELEQDGLSVEVGHEWAALPTVTATAKPAWQQLAALLHGEGASPGAAFAPAEESNGKPLTTERFRELLRSVEVEFFTPAETGNATGCAWTEIGAFDRHGHADGKKLAWRIHEELNEVKHRVRALMEAGWNTIHVVTDHGWLLMPGGLPKFDLPKHLTTSRWGRCALPESGAKHGYGETGWFWNPTLPVVLAPGIGSFVKGLEYAHGGLTLQECLLPALRIRSCASGPASNPELVSAKWKGLRLSVVLRGGAGLILDLRRKAADPNTSVVPETQRGRAVGEGGELSLLLDNDDLLGTAVLLIVNGPDGTVLLKHPITIGEV